MRKFAIQFKSLPEPLIKCEPKYLNEKKEIRIKVLNDIEKFHKDYQIFLFVSFK